MIHRKDNNKRILVNTASEIPVVRARFCWSCGNLPARIEIKMMLSTPNTSSSTINVINAIQVSGCVSHSIKNSSNSNYQQSKANFIQESGSGVERSGASMSNSSQVKWIILVKNHQSTDGEFVTLVQTLEKKMETIIEGIS